MNRSPVTAKVRLALHCISFRPQLPTPHPPLRRPVPLREITPGSEGEAA